MPVVLVIPCGSINIFQSIHNSVWTIFLHTPRVARARAIFSGAIVKQFTFNSVATRFAVHYCHPELVARYINLVCVLIRF